MQKEYQPFQLLEEIIGHKQKRPLSVRREHSIEIARTAKFKECLTCGATASIDDADDCYYCE